MLTEDNLKTILPYLQAYQELVESEIIYERLKTEGHKEAYLEAHSKYEAVLGKLFYNSNPLEAIELLEKMQALLSEARQNIYEELNIRPV